MPLTKSKSVGSRKAGAKTKVVDAIKLLKQDHREVEGYFEDYEEAKDADAKAALSAKICLALKVHTQIEEELFYPSARRATGDDDLLDEAVVEHQGAKQLIAEIEAMNPDDDLYDAKVRVLGENVKHHVEEEEKKLFPETQKTELDVDSLGRQLAARKAELMAELAGARRR